jgi:hypothetical protein
VAQVSDIRYLSKVINGVAVVTAPAEIDITTADQLRAGRRHRLARTGRPGGKRVLRVHYLTTRIEPL